jgi:hypothetical protein
MTHQSPGRHADRVVERFGWFHLNEERSESAGKRVEAGHDNNRTRPLSQELRAQSGFAWIAGGDMQGIRRGDRLCVLLLE